MIPQRLSVKFFVQGTTPVDLAPFVPLFHQWIQHSTVEGLLIDVARYEHVPDGPGVILIAHEVDYGIDFTGGRPGLLVRRKRYDADSDLADILRDTLHKAAIAAQALHNDGSTGVQLEPNTVEIALIDRLRTPNTPEAREAVTPAIKSALGGIYPKGFELRPTSDDSRANLSLIATSNEPVKFDSLLSGLVSSS
jgi:hypothetical protein